MKDLDRPVRRVRGLLEMDHIKIAYDEWNLRAWYHPNNMDLYQGRTSEEYLDPRDENDRNEQYNMADAVFSACFLNMCIRNSSYIGMANFSPAVNTIQKTEVTLREGSAQLSPDRKTVSVVLESHSVNVVTAYLKEVWVVSGSKS